jgi:hypothetical protein
MAKKVTKMTGKEIEKQVSKTRKNTERDPVQLTGTMTFEKDTKRFHCLRISVGTNGANGSLYFPRDGGEVPGKVILTFKKA